jgi:hypothetical protein
MMLIRRDGCFLIDRNFSFRRVQMRFPHKSFEVRFQVMLEKQVHYMTILLHETSVLHDDFCCTLTLSPFH